MSAGSYLINRAVLCTFPHVEVENHITTQNQRIELWGAGTTRTLRPIWVAEELGVPYVLRPIGARTGETQSPEYKQLNPKQKIPLLVDGSIRLSESLAICRYLIDKFPGEAVYQPITPVERAQEDEWCCYIYGEIDETSLYVMRRHRDLEHIYGSAPVAVASAAEYATRHLNVVNDLLHQREFVLEKGFGLADIILTTCLIWALAYSVEVPGQLVEYKDRIVARPAYLRAAAINFKPPEV